MMPFQGFPSGGRVEYASIPKVFFSALLPQITDIAELKTTLYVIAALYAKKGYPRYVGYSELLGSGALVSGLKTENENPEQTLQRALQLAVGRGTFISVPLEKDGQADAIYLLNTESDRQAVERIKTGEITLAGARAVPAVPAPAEAPPDIYTLYEQNVGLLSPLIADELKDAEGRYPQEWLRDAIKEAALHNKRSIKYIVKILENWSAEGRSDGTYQRDTQKTGPDKYVKGKYGHIVQR